jgi:hypothetical protein
MYKGKKTKKKILKKIFCTKYDSTSSDEDEDSGSEKERVLYMEV